MAGLAEVVRRLIDRDGVEAVLVLSADGLPIEHASREPFEAEPLAALTATLDKRFAELNKLLDKYRKNTSSYEFTSYEKVGKADRKELSDAVNALAEPLSKLAAAVTK